MTTLSDLTVVKIGGSLFDLPQLGAGLRAWLSERDDPRILLVPGGGPLAEVVRGYHRTHRLTEETAHWLALRTMQVNAHLLQAMLGEASIVAHPAETSAPLSILDGHGFCTADERAPDPLPHTWQVTSDSVAARCAAVGRATRLVMLKSVELSQPFDWRRAAHAGIVDPAFGEILTQGGFEVVWVNFRAWLASRGFDNQPRDELRNQ